MKTIVLPTIFAVAAHITLSMGYVATVYGGSACNAANPQWPSLSIVGSSLSTTSTGCIAPAVPLSAGTRGGGSFSLTGCASGGTVSIFSDTACTKLLTTISSDGTACAQSLNINSFIVDKC